MVLGAMHAEREEEVVWREGPYFAASEACRPCTIEHAWVVDIHRQRSLSQVPMRFDRHVVVWTHEQVLTLVSFVQPPLHDRERRPLRRLIAVDIAARFEHFAHLTDMDVVHEEIQVAGRAHGGIAEQQLAQQRAFEGNHGHRSPCEGIEQLEQFDGQRFAMFAQSLAVHTQGGEDVRGHQGRSGRLERCQERRGQAVGQSQLYHSGPVQGRSECRLDRAGSRALQARDGQQQGVLWTLTGHPRRLPHLRPEAPRH